LPRFSFRAIRRIGVEHQRIIDGVNTQDRPGELSLYQRLGGYDVIAAVIDDLFRMMQTDARFARFALGRSTDSRKRAQQLFVEQMCALSGGPCHYSGRDMKASHAGLAITVEEWDASIELTRKALQNYGIGGREEAEFLALLEQYKDDIVEVLPSPQSTRTE
jgi:hemoglobin